MPGEFHGQKSLVGYSPWGYTESDMTERINFDFELWFIEVCMGSKLTRGEFIINLFHVST